MRIQRESRPWAVRVRTSRRSSIRAAHGLDHPVEHLGRVRAHLALQPRDERDLVEIAVLPSASTATLKRVLELHAELLLGEHAPELALRGLGARRRRRP